MSYSVQNSVYLIGSNSSDSTLTASYSGNQNVIETGAYENATLLISYTAATGQSGRIATIQVEGSDEQAQFYKLSALQDTATDGTAESFQDLITITGTADTPETRVHQISLGFQYLRVSIKEDGSSNFGTAHIKIVRNEQHT